MLTKDDIINLKNRISAAKKSPKYNDRAFVDVPIGTLEKLVLIAEKLVLIAEINEKKRLR